MSILAENIAPMPRGGVREGAGRPASNIETVAIAVRIPKKVYVKLRKKFGKELHSKLRQMLEDMA